MFGALIVCLVVTAVFYFIDKSRILWWEFFIPIAATLILIFGMKLLVDNASVKFTEYWGETMTSVYEEEPYNYWQVQTCTRSYPCGTDKDGNTEWCTETYDCSHQVDVGPSWYCKTDLNNSYNLTEHQYDSIRVLFGGGRSVTESHNNYSPRDGCSGSRGTKFEGRRVGETSYVWGTNWPGTDQTRKGYFTIHKYENRIKASDLSLFNISVVTDEEADSMGLYKYPDLAKGGWFSGTGNGIYFPTILGKNISKQTQENFRRLNAKFGVQDSLRLWILVFDNKPASVAAYQENYWVKGNQNELVICIGTKSEEITWSHSFSWALSADFTVEVTQKILDLYTVSIETKAGQKLPIAIPINTKMKQIISKGTKIDTALLPPVLPLNLKKTDITKTIKSKTPVLNEQTWLEYYNYLNKNLQRFHRRHFEEFSYIKVVPKTWVVILLYFLALGISFGVNMWTFTNEFTDDNTKGKDSYSHRYDHSFKDKFRY
jgi:hypothetical protein